MLITIILMALVVALFFYVKNRKAPTPPPPVKRVPSDSVATGGGRVERDTSAVTKTPLDMIE